MKDGFNIKRCLTVIRLHLSEQKKPLTALFAITTGLFTLISLLISASAQANLPVYENGCGPYVVKVAELSTFTLIFPIYAIVTGSMTFKCMKNKSSRIKIMMLPANQSEKFIALTTIYTLLADFAFLASWVTADLILSVFHMNLPLWADTMVYTTASNLQSIKIAIMALMVPLTGQALFTLGSTIFPSRPFLLTFCSLIVFGVVIMIPLTGLMASHPIIIQLIFFPFYVSYWSTVAICLGIIALLYMLAWWRFRNMQVVKRFLPN